jgi:hypothetical protein
MSSPLLGKHTVFNLRKAAQNKQLKQLIFSFYVNFRATATAQKNLIVIF